MFDLGFTSFEGHFYQFGQILQQAYVAEVDPGCVYTTVYRLQGSGQVHQRSIYGFLGMIGDLGGVTEVVMILFGFMLYPISEFEFNLKAIKTLFMVRTSDEDLMVTCGHKHDAGIKIPKH